MKTVIDRLKAKGDERAYLLQVLELWNAVERAGIAVGDVKSFTFSEAFLSVEDRRANNRAAESRRHLPFSGKTHHNAIRLKTGELVAIELMERPYERTN